METLQRTANRGSVSTGYEISNSVSLDRFNSQYLQHTYDSAPTNLKKNTFSTWFKRSELDQNQGLYQFAESANDDHNYIRFTRETFNGSNAFLRGKIGGTAVQFLLTEAQFRDTSGWYHVVVVWDTTQSTATDRLELYINGVKQTLFPTDNRASITQNADTANGANGQWVRIGHGVYNGSQYMAETHFVDGQALDATDFGEFDEDSGIWKPKQYTGTYGNNGFYLKFDDSSNMGADSSGNGHTFTLNNISSTDQSTDTPTNNFAVVDINNSVTASASYMTIQEGGTEIKSTENNFSTTLSTFAVNKGKWYVEWKYPDNGSTQIVVGIASVDDLTKLTQTDAYSIYRTCTWYPKQSLSYYKNSGTVVTASATRNSSIAQNDIIGMYIDLDNNHMYFQKNGSDMNVGQVDASTLLFSESSLFDCNDIDIAIYTSVYDTTNTVQWNFGGYTAITNTKSYSDPNGYGNFVYSTTRSGTDYYAMCSRNIQEFG